MVNQRRKLHSCQLGARFVWMLALVMAFTSFPISAAVKQVDAELPPAQAIARSAPSELAGSVEVAAIREQNKLIKEYQSDLLNTVLWALGVVVTLSLLFAGFGWFTNFKLYEADKKSLRDEFAKKIDDFDRNLGATLALNQATNLSALDSRLDSVSAQVLGDRGAARAERDSDQIRVNVALDAIQGLISGIDKKLDKQERNLLLTNANMRIVEETVWKVAKIPTNILISQGQGLEAAVAAKEEFYVKHILGRMKATLNEEFISSGRRFEGQMLGMLEERLQGAESFDAVVVNEVRALIAQANAAVDPAVDPAESAR